MMNDSQKKRAIMIGIFGLVIGFVLIIILFIQNLAKGADLEILIAPSFAKVEMDGKKFPTDKTVKYYPGEYTVKVSAEGFVEQSAKVVLEKGQQTSLYLYLEPTEENAKFYTENYDEDVLMQEIAEKQNDLDSDSYYDKYPIMSILPYEKNSADKFNEPNGFRIDGGKFDKCKREFCLQVSSPVKAGLDEAKEYLKKMGFKPEDYEIIFNYQPIERAKPEDYPEEIRKILEESGYFDQE